jgi:hypothetical protein
MKDHGFCGHLLQRHKAVELEQERSERTIIGVYLSRELEQEGSERTVIGVSMSGLIEQEDQHWCLYERVDMMKMYSIVGYVMYEVSIV